jgi:uncharacterized protein (UPF0261 family)
VLASTASAAIMLPLAGVSSIDCAEQPFDDPVARRSLFDAVRSHCGSCEVIEVDHHINHPALAEAAAGKLIEFMQQEETATT